VTRLTWRRRSDEAARQQGQAWDADTCSPSIFVIFVDRAIIQTKSSINLIRSFWDNGLQLNENKSWTWRLSPWRCWRDDAPVAETHAAARVTFQSSRNFWIVWLSKPNQAWISTVHFEIIGYSYTQLLLWEIFWCYNYHVLTLIRWDPTTSVWSWHWL